MIIARAAELAAQRTPSRSGRGGQGRNGNGPGSESANVLEVSSVEVIPAGEEPVEAGVVDGTAADWLPGIRDEHEDQPGWQARLLDRPTWDRTVTPNIRRRQGTRPPRRRR